ncbi:MAG: glutamate 5-kinase [Cyanobacteria bacterium]|nr:glutamate 5-kinase [Cyanobacteriota bacterium]
MDAQRIVIKLGTQVVIQDEGRLSLEKLSALVNLCAVLAKAGKEIILVSSGAVGLGRNALKLSGKIALSEKQACAAVGQGLLMETYRYLFGNYGLQTAQLLLTGLDFSDRQRYLNLQKTLETLLNLHVIPVINENDTVSTMELQEEGKTKSFGDNDKLSALVASKLDADLLIILTNVDGIFTDNPQQNPDAQRIPLIENLEMLTSIKMDGQSAYGRGGMSSKVEAARIAAISGVTTWIVPGHKIPEMLEMFDQFKQPSDFWPEPWPLGTLILPQLALSGKKRWIGFASGSNGAISVNAGAKTALMERNASLLPSGILSVQGEFQAKQVVSLQDESGAEFARGMVNFTSDDVRKIQGKHSQEIQTLLGPSAESDVVIQRDYLVIFQESTP